MRPWRPALRSSLAVRAPPLTPLAAAVMHVPPPERALVVECGDGEPALLLAREFPAARIRGVDSSAEQVRAASGRVGLDPEGRVAFKVGKPGKLPYPDDFFDLVVRHDGHPSPAETARVLRRGGRLILSRSQPPRIAPAHREKLANARLARFGFGLLRSEDAGDGSFQTYELCDAARSREEGLSR